MCPPRDLVSFTAVSEAANPEGTVTTMFEAPLAHVSCGHESLTVVFTGTDEQMAEAFKELAGDLSTGR